MHVLTRIVDTFLMGDFRQFNLAQQPLAGMRLVQNIEMHSGHSFLQQFATLLNSKLDADFQLRRSIVLRGLQLAGQYRGNC